jgi:hypothetical protein
MMSVELQIGFCGEYERLLEASHRAMRTWNEQRVAICESGAKGRAADLELLREQAKYAKAQAQLQKHVRECVRCSFARPVAERGQAPGQAPDQETDVSTGRSAEVEVRIQH